MGWESSKGERRVGGKNWKGITEWKKEIIFPFAYDGSYTSINMIEEIP
jgi:hypothetical protein